MTTPSNKLSKIVFARLEDEGLIASDDAEKMVEKYAEGKLRQEDWRLSFEKCLDKEDKQ